MLQNMHHMDASCIFYVKVGIFHQLEQYKIFILTVTIWGIAMLIIPYDLIVTACFMYNPGDVWRQTSPAILSVEELPLDSFET